MNLTDVEGAARSAAALGDAAGLTPVGLFAFGEQAEKLISRAKKATEN